MQNVAEAEAKNARLTNMNTRATFTCRVGERWLTIRLEGIGNVIVLLAGLLGVASKGDRYSGFVGAKRLEVVTFMSTLQARLLCRAPTTHAAEPPAGMALVYGMRITMLLSWAVRQATELSVQMNSVERILHYVNNADPEEKPSRVAGPSWTQ
jgi:hypothetical protein|eukprot:COSAG01_NODE_810_length_13426_cov_7.873790_6_plen_153_part_00